MGALGDWVIDALVAGKSLPVAGARAAGEGGGLAREGRYVIYIYLAYFHNPSCLVALPEVAAWPMREIE